VGAAAPIGDVRAEPEPQPEAVGLRVLGEEVELLAPLSPDVEVEPGAATSVEA
jgi:hypothetical protein